jgi:hypothetical protein
LDCSAEELFFSCHCEERSDEAIQPLDGLGALSLSKRLECDEYVSLGGRGRLRLPANEHSVVILSVAKNPVGEANALKQRERPNGFFAALRTTENAGENVAEK